MSTKKMWNFRTIIFAAVSRRDLCYVLENEGLILAQTSTLNFRGGCNNK